MISLEAYEQGLITHLPDPLNRFFLELVSLQHYKNKKLNYYLPILQSYKNKQSKIRLFEKRFFKMLFSGFILRGMLNSETYLGKSKAKAVEEVFKKSKVRGTNKRHISGWPLNKLKSIETIYYYKKYYSKNYPYWKTILEALNFLHPYADLGGFVTPVKYSEGLRFLQFKQAIVEHFAPY